MQSKYLYILFLILAAVFFSCTSKPDFSEEPQLEYIGIDRNQVTQGRINSDSLFLFFEVTDGDGDIGISDNQSTLDLVLTDSRTNEVYSFFKTPEVPIQGSNNGIIANFQVKVFTTCCLFPENIPPCSTPEEFPQDTFKLQIQITDRAGNQSNVVESENIILLCN